jgi:hypothetical protein
MNKEKWEIEQIKLFTGKGAGSLNGLLSLPYHASNAVGLDINILVHSTAGAGL